MDTLVSSSNKTDRHDITEILLKVTLNTIIPTNPFNTQTTLFAVKTYFLEINLDIK
jgi:hypothetical protein